MCLLVTFAFYSCKMPVEKYDLTNCTWTSLVAQSIKNPPAVWETWVRSLGWEDSLEEGMATYSSILAGRIPKDRGGWRTAVHGVAKSQVQLSDLRHTNCT